MQKMIRWQVEAVKSGRGVVLGFRIVTLRWERKDIDAKWEKLSPDDIDEQYTLYHASLLDELRHKEYLKLLKINFVSAFRRMTEMASNFAEDIVISHNKIGLNWIEYIWEDKDELDRRTSDENRVSDNSEITREC